MSRVRGEIFGKDLCLALGIPIDNVFRLVIDCKVEGAAEIIIYRYATDKLGKRIIGEITEKYEVVKHNG